MKSGVFGVQSGVAILGKNPDDPSSFLGSPSDRLFGSQRTLVSGDLRVPKGDPESGAKPTPKSAESNGMEI